MEGVEQTPWVDISNPTDRKVGISRYVKTLSVRHPSKLGDVVKLNVEAVSRHRADRPPDDCFNDGFCQWLLRR